MITLSFAVCALVYAPLAAVELPARTLSAEVVASMATLTVICTALAFVLVFALIGEIGAMRATVITYVNPAVAVLLGVTVLDERFELTTALGFGLILAGSLLATAAPRGGPPRRDVPASGRAG